MSAKQITVLKHAESRVRMAALRQARKSRPAALREQRRASLVQGAARWRVTNLASVLRAMA